MFSTIQLKLFPKNSASLSKLPFWTSKLHFMSFGFGPSRFGESFTIALGPSFLICNQLMSSWSSLIKPISKIATTAFSVFSFPSSVLLPLSLISNHSPFPSVVWLSGLSEPEKSYFWPQSGQMTVTTTIFQLPCVSDLFLSQGGTIILTPTNCKNIMV